MFDLSLQQVIFRVLAFLYVSTVHGLFLAALARGLGDKGVGYDGRLTANPLVHLDLLGLVGGIIGRVGWSKWMNIDAKALHGKQAGLVLAVLASLALTVVAGLALLQIQGLVIRLAPPNATPAILAFLRVTAEMSIYFALINLLPFPPFAGGHFLAAVAPRALVAMNRYAVWLGVAVIAVLVLAGPAVVRPVIAPVVARLMG